MSQMKTESSQESRPRWRRRRSYLGRCCTVCPGVAKIHFLTCQILDTMIVFLQIYHEGGSVGEKVLHRNNFKRICGLKKMITLSFAQNDYHLYGFNFVSKTSQISLKKMVDPVLESSLETETGNIIKNKHFDNYHPKKGS